MNENDDNSYRCDDFIHMSTVPVIMKMATLRLAVQKIMDTLWLNLFDYHYICNCLSQELPSAA